MRIKGVERGGTSSLGEPSKKEKRSPRASLIGGIKSKTGTRNRDCAKKETGQTKPAKRL